MIDGALPVQAAIVAAIETADLLPIHDRVPKGASFPYASFGPFLSVDASDQCHAGVEVSVQVDVWSRSVGFVEVRGLATQLAALLDAPLTVAGFEVVIHECEAVDTRREGDGLTSRSILRFRYVLAPTA